MKLLKQYPSPNLSLEPILASMFVMLNDSGATETGDDFGTAPQRGVNW